MKTNEIDQIPTVFIDSTSDSSLLKEQPIEHKQSKKKKSKKDKKEKKKKVKDHR